MNALIVDCSDCAGSGVQTFAHLAPNARTMYDVVAGSADCETCGGSGSLYACPKCGATFQSEFQVTADCCEKCHHDDVCSHG